MLKTKTKILTDLEVSELDLTKKSDRDKLILSFVPIVSNIVIRYCNLPELEFDELQAEALLKVVEAVDKLSRIDHDNRGAYLNVHIHSACIGYLRKNSRYKTTGNIEQLITDNIFDGNFFDAIEFYDCLDYIVQTKNEKLVLDLRKKGYNDTKIKELTGLSRNTIGNIRHTLFKRFERLWI